jgi:hypothetical protein
MIVSASTASASYSVDPTAAALSASLRPASFSAARREDDSVMPPARALDIERLYPNLVHASEPAHRISVPAALAASVRALRRAFAAV